MTLRPWAIIIWTFLAVPPALGRRCTANQRNNQTTYTVQDMPDVDCSYSWTNKTGNVLANEAQSIPELVLRHSSRALTTSRCLDVVHYEGTCGPKWEKQTMNCTLVCVKKSGEANSTNEVEFMNVKSSIKETSIIVAAVIVVGLILAVLWCILKKKCIWKRSPIKGAYAGAELKTGQQGDHELEQLPV